MNELSTSIEGILESILRGAAKILGCISANLVVIDKESQLAKVRIGTIAEKQSEVDEVETVFGDTIQKINFAIGDIDQSLVYATWRDGRVYETSSLTELIGRAFNPDMVSRVESMIGDQRFICVPVDSGRSRFGVIIFTKDDLRPYGLQRREILLRYAQRIGEIVENELRGHDSGLPGNAVFPSTTIGHFLFGSDGELVGRSRPSLDAAGYREQGLPADVSVLLPRITEHIRAHELQGSELPDPLELLPVELTPQDPDGRFTHYLAEFTRMEMNGTGAVLCTVSGRHQKAASQSGQQQLMHFALGDIASAVLVDPEFVITSCNEATERLFGYKPDELRKQSISTLFEDEKDIQSILNHKFLFLSDGYHEDITTVRHKSGKVFAGRIEALLLADEGNQVIGYLVLIHDHSHLIGAGREGDSIHHLMRKERLATMGEMAAQLAHEIRNPLVSIGATLHMLTREEYRHKDNLETLQMLADEVTRMDIVLKDYLSISAHRNDSVSRVDLAEVVQDALRLLRGTQATEGKKITSSVGQGIQVLADYDGLRHVFHNLLQNAMEATPTGGDIQCHALLQDGNVTVHIDDRGTGLSCGANECLKPFFTTKVNGTGLGLAVCEKIIKLHAGTISLKNRKSGGCRASVVLPRGRPQ